MCINWLIGHSQTFSSLCYLLLLHGDVLCLCLAGSDNWKLLGLLSVFLLALYLQNLFFPTQIWTYPYGSDSICYTCHVPVIDISLLI